MLIPLLILIIEVLIIFFIFLYYESSEIKIISYKIKDNKLVNNEKGKIKIIYFSDLHLGSLIKKKELHKILKKLRALNGDVYLFGGDIFGIKLNKYYDEKIIKDEFSIFKDKKCFAVYGNHEFKKEKGISQDYKEKIFQALGFKILKDEKVSLKIKGENLDIYGMNDYNYHPCILPNEKCDLILAHEPDCFSKLKEGIMLSGHTHGGQIKIPFIPLYYRPKNGKKYTHGLYEKDKASLLVNNGLGFGKLKIRMFAKREIVVLYK